MALVTWQEIRDHLGNPSGATQAELEDVLAEAMAVLEAETGRPLEVRTVTQRTPLDTDGPDGVVIDVTPCPCSVCADKATMTLTGLTVGGTTVAATDRRLDGVVVSWASTVAPSSTAHADQQVVVTYQAGYTAAPAWLTLAVKRLCEHLWQKTQQAPHPALSQVGGGYDESQPSGLSYLLPYQVASLIDRHRVLA